VRERRMRKESGFLGSFARFVGRPRHSVGVLQGVVGETWRVGRAEIEP
jgi:hypothetical protein